MQVNDCFLDADGIQFVVQNHWSRISLWDMIKLNLEDNNTLSVLNSYYQMDMMVLLGCAFTGIYKQFI